MKMDGPKFRRRAWTLAVAAILFAAPACTLTQTEDDVAKNAQKARAALNEMVQALGGQAWLDIKNQMQQGHVAAFFHGQPDLGTTDLWQFHAWPDRDRVEVTKHRDVVEFYIGRDGWEVTYRGKKAMQKDLLDDFLRRRDHSIETAVKVWLKDPQTILVYEGQTMAERHLAEQVTLISPQNEAITIKLDQQTHLPLSRSFQWRDPIYKDKNTDTEEYDDYHVLDQYYVTKVEYNRPLPDDFWNVDTASQKIKK
jgi:hypothetical protein